tara:strand:- start:80 stop:487 length:408 start_codon:yes stop_codon:yes gene_type:complete
MAYMNQQLKKELAPEIKNVLKKHGYKGTIGVNNHSTLVVNIKEGTHDFISIANEKAKEMAERRGHPYYPSKGYVQVNPYYPEHYGEAAPFVEDLIDAMKGNSWYNNSDIQTDYFDIAYYIDINIGKWDKPYCFNP